MSNSISFVNIHDNLKLCLFNAQSVCKDEKADEIADFIVDNDLDVTVITESWLHLSGDEPIISSLTPCGYRLASFPRPSRGGGIAIIYKDCLSSHLSFTTSLPFDIHSFEFVEAVSRLPGQTIILSCIYRPPPNTKNKLTNSMFFSEFDCLLDHYSISTGKLIILGDFNFHYDKADHPDTKRLCESLSNHNLLQHVTQPTHRHGHTLDWVISRPVDNLVIDTDISSSLTSDHSAVLISLNLPLQKKSRTMVYRRNLNAVVRDDFFSDASDLLSDHSSTDLPVFFDLALRQLLDKYAPATKRLIPDRPPAPWLTPQILSAKRERRKAERRWRSSNLTVHKQMFYSARSKVSKMISASKRKHFENKILSSTSSKALFSTVNTLLGTTNTSPLPSVYSKESLPAAFSTFFDNRIQTLRDKLDALPSQPCLPDPAFTGTSLSSFHPVSQDEVYKTIQSMSFKTCELDPLPASLYSDGLLQLLPFITDIINSSLSSGIVPDIFKSAIVRPLLKKHNLDKNDLKNYRPVSNLSFLSKLLEKIVLTQLNTHLSINDLFHPYQSAYRQHHSTETALLHILNDLLLSTDSGNISVLTLLDLSAAFDTIDHSILLNRLQYTFGIHGTALSWFTSYIKGRHQSVLIEGISSDPVNLTCGVPQGSVLGPVLFTLYTYPLARIIQQHNIKYHLYADDTQLHDNDRPNNIQALLTRTSNSLTDIKNWMTTNKLILNDDKTEAMLIGTQPKLLQLPPSLHLQLDNTSIAFLKSVKSLGVILDSSLSMKNFISATVRSCYFHLRRISLIRKYLSNEAASKLIISLILSRIDYGNSLLSGLPETSILPLQRLQNNAAKLILKKRKRDHSTPLLKALHWLPVAQRIQYKILCLCYKALNNSAPSYLSNSLQIYTPSRTLRSASDPLLLRIPRTKLSTFGSRSFSAYGPFLWNTLPLSIRQKPSLSSFKSALKTHLFQQF